MPDHSVIKTIVLSLVLCATPILALLFMAYRLPYNARKFDKAMMERRGIDLLNAKGRRHEAVRYNIRLLMEDVAMKTLILSELEEAIDLALPGAEHDHGRETILKALERRYIENEVALAYIVRALDGEIDTLVSIRERLQAFPFEGARNKEDAEKTIAQYMAIEERVRNQLHSVTPHGPLGSLNAPSSAPPLMQEWYQVRNDFRRRYQQELEGAMRRRYEEDRDRKSLFAGTQKAEDI